MPLVVRLEGTNVELGKQAPGRVGAGGHRRRRHGRRGEEDRRRCASGGQVAMSILVDKNTKVLVQGITGSAGTFHAKQMREYGTAVVGGVTPGKGGTTHEGFPVFDTVARGGGQDRRQRHGHLRAAAVRRRRHPGGGRRRHRASSSASPRASRSSTWCAPSARWRDYPKLVLVGPNCPGVITPGECKIGIMPGYIHTPGPDRHRVALGHADLRGRPPADRAGHRPVDRVGIGGDPVKGIDFIDCLQPVRGRPADQGGADDRRDRRHLRGGGGPLREGRT